MIGSTNMTSPNNAIKVQVEEKTFTVNGDYLPRQGYLGFNPVHIAVPTGYDMVNAYLPAGYQEFEDNDKVILNPTTESERHAVTYFWKVAKPMQNNFSSESLTGFIVGNKKVDSNNNTYYNVKTLLDTSK